MNNYRGKLLILQIFIFSVPTIQKSWIRHWLQNIIEVQINISSVFNILLACDRAFSSQCKLVIHMLFLIYLLIFLIVETLAISIISLFLGRLPATLSFLMFLWVTITLTLQLHQACPNLWFLKFYLLRFIIIIMAGPFLEFYDVTPYFYLIIFSWCLSIFIWFYVTIFDIYDLYMILREIYDLVWI